MQTTRKKVPDVLRRGLRLSLGVGAACAVGFSVDETLTGWRPQLAANAIQGAKWAAITCIVVSAPVIGRVTRVGFERSLGTVLGGLLGYLVCIIGPKIPTIDDQVFIILASMVLAFTVTLAGRALSLEYSATLFLMTFILVTMAANDHKDAALVAATRISGILFGVFLSIALSIVVFPKSANCEAVDCMSAALRSLAQLHALAWRGANLAVSVQLPTVPPPTWRSSAFWLSKRKKQDRGYVHLGTADPNLLSHQDQLELECEKVLMHVYDKLGSCEAFLKDAVNETYLTTFRGRWCFLPGVFCLPLGRWRLPVLEMLELATSARKLGRSLWGLHTILQHGLDQNTLQLLDQRYPERLLQHLQETSHGAIQDMVEAFPNHVTISSANLYKFHAAYQVLVRTSDFHRRRLVRLLKYGIGLEAGQGAGMVQPSEACSNGSAYQTGSTKASLEDAASSAHATEPSHLLLFPDTTIGHMAEVKWWSLQFLLQQLAEELSDTHTTLSRLLLLLPQAALQPEETLPMHLPLIARAGSAILAPAA